MSDAQPQQRFFSVCVRKKLSVQENDSQPVHSVWLERYMLIPFVPYTGLDIGQGEFRSGPIVECHWDTTERQFIALTAEDSYTAQQPAAKLASNSMLGNSLLARLRAYLSKGWSCCTTRGTAELRISVSAEESLALAAAEGAHALNQYALDLEKGLQLDHNPQAGRIIKRRAQNYREKAKQLSDWARASREALAAVIVRT